MAAGGTWAARSEGPETRQEEFLVVVACIAAAAALASGVTYLVMRTRSRP